MNQPQAELDPVALWREHNPGDQRNDDLIALDIAREFPESIEVYPKFRARIERIKSSTPVRSVAQDAAATLGVTAQRVVADPAIGLLKGAIGIPEAAVGLADIVTGGAAGKAAEDVIGFRPKEAKAALEELQSDDLKAAKQRVAEAEGFVPTVVEMVKNPSTIVDMAAESAPPMLAGGSIGRVARYAPEVLVPIAELLSKTGIKVTAKMVAAGLGEGAVSAGQNVEQVRQESKDGLLTAKQAVLPAVSGAVTGLLGIAGSKASKALGLADIDTLATQGKLTKAQHGLLARIIGGALSEGLLEELPQSLQEAIAQNLAMGRPWNQGVAEAAAGGMLVGGLMGGVGNVPGNNDPAGPTPKPNQPTAEWPPGVGPSGSINMETPPAPAAPVGVQDNYPLPQGEQDFIKTIVDAERLGISTPEMEKAVSGFSPKQKAVYDEMKISRAEPAPAKATAAAPTGTPAEVGTASAPPAPSATKAAAPESGVVAKPAGETLRLYHGGAGEKAGDNFTPFLDYAQGYARKSGGKVWYVDVPANSPFLSRDEVNGGVLIGKQVVPVEIADSAKPLPPDPTPAQKEAGNYKKDHVKVQGLDITIENQAGTTRSGMDKDGNEWAVEMPAHYGYFKRTEGKDGDQVDVYVGSNPESQKAFIVDQLNTETGKFDEHKTMLGFNSIEDARKAYLAGFSDNKGRQRLGAISEMSVDELKKWLKTDDTTKPFAWGKKAAPKPDTEEARLESQAEAALAASTNSDDAEERAQAGEDIAAKKVAEEASALEDDLARQQAEYEAKLKAAKAASAASAAPPAPKPAVPKAKPAAAANWKQHEAPAEAILGRVQEGKAAIAKGSDSDSKNLIKFEKELDLRFPDWRKNGIPDDATVMSGRGVSENAKAKHERMLKAGELGIGKKEARLFEDFLGDKTEDADELYKDSKGDAESDNSISRKLAVLQSPDGSHVLIATAYVNKGRKVAMPGSKGRSLSLLIEDGWKLVGSIKTDEPTSKYAVTMSTEAWGKVKEELVSMRGAASRTAEAGMAHIENAREYGRQERGDEHPTGDDKADGVAMVDAATGEKVAVDAVASSESESEEFTTAHADAIIDATSSGKAEDYADESKGVQALARDLRDAGQDAVEAFKTMVRNLGEDGVEKARQIIYESKRIGSKSAEELAKAVREGGQRRSVQDAGNNAPRPADAPARQQATDSGRLPAENRGGTQAPAAQEGSGSRVEARANNGEKAQPEKKRVDPFAAAAKPAEKSLGQRLSEAIGEPKWETAEEAEQQIKDAIAELPAEDQVKLGKLIGADFEEHAEIIQLAYEKAAKERVGVVIDGYLKQREKSANVKTKYRDEEQQRYRPDPLPPGAREEKLGAAGEAVSAVLGRIHQSIFGSEPAPTSPRERIALYRRIKPREQAELEKFAKDNGLILDSEDFARKWEKHKEEIEARNEEEDEDESEGAEHIVYPKDGYYYKANKGEMAKETLLQYFDRLRLHNWLFPSTKYEFLGFVKDPKAMSGERFGIKVDGFGDGTDDPDTGLYGMVETMAEAKKYAADLKKLPAYKNKAVEIIDRAETAKLLPVVRQIKVVAAKDAKGTVEATAAEIKQDMARNGFSPIPMNLFGKRVPSVMNFYNPRLGIVVEDLHTGNVLKGPHGDLIYIDPIISMARREEFKKHDAVARDGSWLGGGRLEDFRPPMTKNRAEQIIRDSQMPDAVARAKFIAAVDNLRLNGIKVSQVREFVGEMVKEFGKYEEWKGAKDRLVRAITISMADAESPSRENLITLFHEAGHAAFSKMSVEDQARLVRAISEASNEWLGIGDYKERVDNGDVAVEQEGRLVESVAQKLAAEGFDPADASGIVQSIVRAVKTLYQGVVIGLSKVIGRNISKERALEYAKLRVESLLAGDKEINFTAWMGGRKWSKADYATDFERAMAAGEMVRFRDSFSTSESQPEISPDINSTAANTHRVAAHAFIDDVLRKAFEIFNSEGLNTAGISFEAFAKHNLVRLPESIGNVEHYRAGELPGDIIARANEGLKAIGQAEIPATIKLDALNRPTAQQAAALAHKILKVYTDDMAQKRAEIAGTDKLGRLTRNNNQLIELMSKYTDMTAVLDNWRKKAAGMADTLRKSAATIGTESHRKGILEQVISYVEGRTATGRDAAEYVAALDRIGKKLGVDEAAGMKFSDALETIARMDIDWKSTPADEIIEFIGDEKMLGDLAATLGEKNTKALIAGIVAFGKENRVTMDLLAIRRGKAEEGIVEVNKALKLALENHAEAVETARKSLKAGPLMVKAMRLLDSIKEIKAENRELFDEIERDRKFVEWHEAAKGMLASKLTELERKIGAQWNEFELVQGADIPSVPKPTATMADVLESTKKVDLSPQGWVGIRAEMQKLRAWLDNIPEGDRGADWSDLDRVYHKTCAAAIFEGHDAVQQNLVMRMLAPIPDRFRFIGTPVTKLLGSKFFQYQADLRQYFGGAMGANRRGEVYEAAERQAMVALGYKAQDVFRRSVLSPVSGWLKANRELVVSEKSESAILGAAVNGALRRLEMNPDLKPKLADPKTRRAVEALIRAHTENSIIAAANGKAMGIKILDVDGKYKVYREVIGAAPFTVLERFTDYGMRVINLMKGSDWNGDKLTRSRVLSMDHEALRDILKQRVTPEMWNTFFREFAYREGRTSFYAPETGDGLKRFASRENVIKAYQAANGDLLAFCEALYSLEGGGEPIGHFVAETVSTWQSLYDMVHGYVADAEQAAGAGMPWPTVRRFLGDARKSEELPAVFKEPVPLDRFGMVQITRGQVYQKNFGRNMKLFRENMTAAKAEQQSLAGDFNVLLEHYRDQGLTGRALEKAMQNEVEGGWKDSGLYNQISAISRTASWQALKQAGRNAQELNKLEDNFNSMITMNQDRPLEFRAAASLLGAITGMTVSGPATALTDNIATVEQPFRRMGFSWDAVKMILETKKNEAVISANSLLQTFGTHLSADVNDIKLLNEIGMADLDALISVRDKAAAVLVEEHSLARTLPQKAAWKVSSAMRMFMDTGIGRAKEGAPVFPTLKPQSPFLMGAQVSQMATALAWIKRYRSFVAAAVKHFDANPLDAANPDFKFKQADLKKMGWNSGWRAYEYYSDALSKRGLGGLEQVAREAYEARRKDKDASLLTKKHLIALKDLSADDITGDSGVSTRAPWLVTTPGGVALNHITGWALNKSYDFAMGLRSPDGQRTAIGLRTGLVALVFGVLPAAMAYALLRDLFDEEVMKRKSNTRDLTTITGPKDALLTMMDNAARVGTFGILGEKLNQYINFDSARPVSLDSRIFVVSSVLSLERAIQGIAFQGGNADWATVYRPMLSAVGGSGYLQYADALNGVFGMDNQEARYSRRTAVNNYLRSAGKELNLDVRRTTPGQAGMPSPWKPYIGQMIMAAYANDHQEFQAAYREAKRAIAESSDAPMTSKEIADKIAKSYSGMSPLRVVFQSTPTELEYRKALGIMSDEGRYSVAEALRLYNHYGAQIGASNSGFGKQAIKPTTFKLDPVTLSIAERARGR